jgi:hypothetical protein
LSREISLSIEPTPWDAIEEPLGKGLAVVTVDLNHARLAYQYSDEYAMVYDPRYPSWTGVYTLTHVRAFFQRPHRPSLVA